MSETEIAPALQADIDWYRRTRDEALREAKTKLSSAESFAAKLRNARVQAGIDADADDGTTNELRSIDEQLRRVIAEAR